MCYVDLEKAYDSDPQGILWSCYGVLELLLRAMQSLYNQSKSCVCILGISRTCLQCVLDYGRAAPSHRLRFSWTESQGVIMGRLVWEPQDLLFADDVVLLARTFSAHCSGLLLSVKWPG